MAKKAAVKKTSSKDTVSSDEQVGYHKGSLHTLMKEREELMRIIGIVDHLIQMHSSALKDLGVNTQEDPKVAKKEPAKRKVPIDELI